MTKIKFNKIYVIVVLVVAAILLFALVNYHSLVAQYKILNYVQITAFGLLLLAAYVYLAVGVEMVINDRKVRWVKASKRLGGRNIMPMWREIEGTLHTEAWGSGENRLELIMYAFINSEDGLRHAYVLDDKANIIDQYNPHVNKLSFSDWRRMTMDKAYGTARKKTLEEAIDICEKHGFAVQRKSKSASGQVRTINTESA